MVKLKQQFPSSPVAVFFLYDFRILFVPYLVISINKWLVVNSLQVFGLDELAVIVVLKQDFLM